MPGAVGFSFFLPRQAAKTGERALLAVLAAFYSRPKDPSMPRAANCFLSTAGRAVLVGADPPAGSRNAARFAAL